MADTALVLGAGGVTGTAWEVVGAQLASGLTDANDLYERRLADRLGARAGDIRSEASASRAGLAQCAAHTEAVASVWSG